MRKQRVLANEENKRKIGFLRLLTNERSAHTICSAKEELRAREQERKGGAKVEKDPARRERRREFAKFERRMKESVTFSSIYTKVTFHLMTN